MKLIKFVIIFLLLLTPFSIIKTEKAYASSGCTVQFPSTNFVSGNITVNSSTAPFVIWARIKAQSSDSSNLYVQIDNNCPVNLGGSLSSDKLNQWTWINFKNGNSNDVAKTSLSSGQHLLKVHSPHALAVDRILLLNNQCVPSKGSNGNECMIISTSPTTRVTQTVSPTTSLVNSNLVPTNVSAESTSDSKAVVKWDGVPGATRYNIYITEQGDKGVFRKKTSTSATSITFTDLNSNELALFYVTAIVNNIETSKSNNTGAYIK